MSWAEDFGIDSFDIHDNEIINGDIDDDVEIEFESISRTTSKALLISTRLYDFWVPRSISKIRGKTIIIPGWYKVEKLNEIEEIEGEVFIENIIPMTPIQTFDKIPPKVLEEIFTSVHPDYKAYEKSNFKGTYAEWCSKDLPF